ncbi:MAG TPA: ABC transporter permease, partial [Firmicutes bacterium]|nr:ABC transporter permease [Bacillota bacterium]
MEALSAKSEFVSLRKELRKKERKLFVSRFLSNRLAVVGAVIIVGLLLFTFLGPLFVSYTPYEQNVRNRLQPPSREHILGTDNLGRDLMSRVAHGARTSMIVGFSVAVSSSVIGMAVGLTASYYPKLEGILMRICDAIMCFPPILLSIALMAALGGSTTNVILALSFVSFPGVARVVRSVALVVRDEAYIEALEAQGASALRIIVLHIIPNTISKLSVACTI